MEGGGGDKWVEWGPKWGFIQLEWCVGNYFHKKIQRTKLCERKYRFFFFLGGNMYEYIYFSAMESSNFQLIIQRTCVRDAPPYSDHPHFLKASPILAQNLGADWSPDSGTFFFYKKLLIFVFKRVQNWVAFFMLVWFGVSWEHFFSALLVFIYI